MVAHLLADDDMTKKTGTISTDTLTGGAADDELFGLGGKDLLLGNAGNDYLDGGAGDDDLRGGAGNDIYIVDNAGDITIGLPDAGSDAVGALLSYVLGPNQENLTLLGNAALTGTGNAGNNLLNGNDAANILIGLAGKDVLDGRKGIDDLRGGSGDDLYLVDNAREIKASLRDDGRDQVQSTVSFVLGGFQEELVLRGTAALAGSGNAGRNFLRGNDGANVLHGRGDIDVLQGGKGKDQLFGDAGNDQVFGEADADILHGGEGNDGLEGGDGNDQLFGDAGIDQLFGLAGADTLRGDAGNDFLYGGTGNDILFGGDGNDFLRGDAGIDVMHGGAGDDTYEVDSGLELNKSELDPGTDRVMVNFDYTLGVNQEILAFYGTGTRHVGFGNAQANTIFGSDAAADELYGLAGNDTLVGGKGNDRLFGGEGNDFLRGDVGVDAVHGGAGNDIYEIDAAAELDKAEADLGNDTVGVNFNYTLGDNQENLYFYGTGTHHVGTGNAFNNKLIGSDGAVDELFGGAGDDQLEGKGGIDILHVGAGNDTYVIDSVGELNKGEEDAGTDTVGANFDYTLGAHQENLYFYGTGTHHIGIGNAFDNQLIGSDGAVDELFGGAGDDQLEGRGGVDILHVGAGNDTYVIDALGELNKNEEDAGIDTVGANFDYTLGAHQENLTFYGAGTHHIGTGNAFDNQLIGTDGAVDELFGGAGDDHLEGRGGLDILHVGAGNDTYVIDSVGELNKDEVDAGTDTVGANFDYTLGTHQENLYFYGTGTHHVGIGNALDNQLFGTDGAVDELSGGAGDDHLEGRGGADILHASAGDDTYVIDSLGELNQGEEDAGQDTVGVNVDYTLGANQEHLYFYGTGTHHLGTGNGLANTLTGTAIAVDELFGGAGNDTLNGRAGDDHLVGDDGDDTYIVDHLGDIDGADLDAGVDTVISSITYTLLTHQENLGLQVGTVALNGTGNAKANLIEGNAGANILHGGQGDDEIKGLGGADSLFGDEGDDLLHYSSAATLIDGGANGVLGDALILTGAGPNVTLDLTTIADTVIKGVETIGFAASQAHTLTMNATDVLALSDTTDLLKVFGEVDDAVNLTGGGWSKDAGTVGSFQGYTAGGAHVQIDLDILAANVTLT